VFAGAASTVLAYLFPDKADDFKARAEEAVQVWVQAGLHYPSDVKADLELGRAVGALIVEWAKPDRVGGLRCDGGVLGRKIYLLGDPALYAGSDAAVCNA
jgi:hypothetical protein